MRFNPLPLSIAALLASVATVAVATDYQKEFDKKIKATQDIGVLGPGLAGDSTNYYTGSTRFSATDISLPGNGMAISLSRVFDVENEHQVASVKATVSTETLSTRLRAFGDWDLDIPHINTTMTQSPGWVVNTATPNNRCSVSSPATGAPPAGTGTKSTVWDPGMFWSGYTLHTGAGDQSLLLASLTNPQRPSAGGPFYWTTNQDWWVSCLPSLAGPLNASSLPPAGEGYVAISPDGTKYTFNWLSKRNVTATTERTETSPTGGGTRTKRLFRAEYLMLPTRIEDRFGNWIQYSWTNDAFARLQSITAGPVGSAATQTITVQYNAQTGFIQSASNGTRTWTYTYSGSSLTQVLLPDSSTWQYSFAALANRMPAEPYCEGDPTTQQWYYLCYGGGAVSPNPVGAYVVHPSGARVDFTFDNHWQHSSISRFIHPFGLTQKVLSGPGLAAATWKVFYLPTVDQAVAAGQAGAWPTRNMTDLVNPDGSMTRNVFGITPAVDEATLLGKFDGSLTPNGGGSPPITTSARWGADILDDPTPATGSVPTFYREQDYRYVPSSQSVPYIVRVGVNPLSATSTEMQIFASERRLPIQKSIATLQAATFVAETTAFNEYAQPAAVTRSSAGLIGPLASYSRTELRTYETDTAKWVVGQVKTVTCSGNSDCTPNKVVSKTDYDATTRLPWKVYGFDQVNPEATLTYNANGTVATAKDGLGHTTTLGTWTRGVPTLITFPNSTAISADVGPSGIINWTRDEFSSQTCYGYDPLDRLTSITYTSEAAPNTCNTSTWAGLGRTFLKIATAEYGLPADHWRQIVTTGNAKTSTYYDAQWRPVLTLSEDAANAATRSFVVTRYDGLGRQTFKSYPVATLTSINDVLKGVRTTYDGLGRVVQVQQDSENVGGQTVLNTSTSYISGFRTQATNPRGKATTTSYQVYDSPSTDVPVSILHPASVVTTIARQPSLGKPVSVTRAGPYGATLSATRSYVYDSNERLCKTINPESNSALVDYDLAGNVIWSADGMVLPLLQCDRGSVPLAEKTNRYYDSMNRVTWVQTPGNIADVSTSYFADGSVNTIAAANPGNNPVVTSYAYNRRRLMTGEASQNGSTVFYLSYGYNANAHLSALTYPDGQVVGYSPDALGRTTQVAVVGQTYASGIAYHPTGAISGFTYGNQIAHSMTPNIRQLPGRSWDVYGGNTVLDDTYAYDANGNVDYITDALPESATSHTRDLGYDDLDRLIVADSPNAVWGQATYSYDPLDNLRTVTIANQTGTTRSHFYNYNAATNQLISISGPTGHGAYGFTYDARGNTTWKNVGTANCNTYPVLQCVGKVPQTYVFDRANRLSQVTGVQTYRYDGLGRRVQTTDADGKTTFWMYSQSGQVLYSSEARRSQNISYLYLGNTQVATRTVAWVTGTTTVRYQHTDALGSPVVETDAGRNITDKNVYSPWGEAWGTTVVDGTGYTGHVMDQGTGLTYMQQRYYDPQVGRFLSADPIPANPNNGENFNSFWYTNNNPFGFTDPDGRQPCSDACMKQRATSDGGTASGGFGPGSGATDKKTETTKEPKSNPASTQSNSKSTDTPEPLYCTGSYECDFAYNQDEFLRKKLSEDEFVERTVAQGKAGVVGGAVVIGGYFTGVGVVRLATTPGGRQAVLAVCVLGGIGCRATPGVQGGLGRFREHREALQQIRRYSREVEGKIKNMLERYGIKD